MWYKFSARYGPGHQSSGCFYEWFDEKPCKAQLQDKFDHFFGDREDAVGSVIKTKLPENIRLSKIRKYLNQIAEAQKMLNILEE